MKITILTLFPAMFDGFLASSIIKRAIAKGVVEVKVVNIRDYTKDRYGRTDTPPVGGGAGLVMKCQPIVDCLRATATDEAHKVLLSPRGKTYAQRDAERLSKLDELVLIAGHYEGVDERVSSYVDEKISLGDFVLTGGEIAAMAVADSVIRLLEGAIASASLGEESFSNGLLEYPQYTEPRIYEGKSVPDILYSGNHEAIRKYRLRESLRLTRKERPDLFNAHKLSEEEKDLLAEIDSGVEEPGWLLEALKKGKKFTGRD